MYVEPNLSREPTVYCTVNDCNNASVDYFVS